MTERHVGSPEHAALWDAINALVQASGGRNTVSTARMTAVAHVERALDSYTAAGERVTVELEAGHG